MNANHVKPPELVPFVTVFKLVFGASVRELLRRRRLYFIGLAGMIPLFFTLVWRMWGMDFLDAPALLANLVGSLYLGILVYLVGVAFGVPTVHDEVDGRTITYLFTRPVSKMAIYSGRLAAVQLLAGALLALSLVGCFLVMVFGNAAILNMTILKAYVGHVWVVMLATVLFTGLFSIFGTLFKKPLVWSLVYAFGWEGVVAKVPGRLQTWTLDFHLRNLMLRDEDVQNSMLDAFRALLVDNVQVSAWTSLAILLIAIVAFSLIGGWVFSRREYVIN